MAMRLHAHPKTPGWGKGVQRAISRKQTIGEATRKTDPIVAEDMTSWQAKVVDIACRVSKPSGPKWIEQATPSYPQKGEGLIAVRQPTSTWKNRRTERKLP